LRPAGLWWLPIGRVPEVKAQDLKRWLENGQQPRLVDARTRFEYESGTIEDAQFAPLTDTPAVLERLDLDDSQPVVVLCRSGHRSRPGTRWLRAKGIEAYSLQGGINAWLQAGFTLNSPNGASSRDSGGS